MRHFQQCLGSDYSRPTADDIVRNFPLPFTEIDAMQQVFCREFVSKIWTAAILTWKTGKDHFNCCFHSQVAFFPKRFSLIFEIKQPEAHLER